MPYLRTRKSNKNLLTAGEPAQNKIEMKQKRIWLYTATMKSKLGYEVVITLEAGRARILNTGKDIYLTLSQLRALAAANEGTVTRTPSDIVTRWRVTDTAGRVLYYNDREEAATAAATIGTRARRVLLKPRHTVTAWGYVPRGYARVEAYAGQYGRGYLEHHETRAEIPGRRLCSSRYHYATYFIEL